MQKYFFLSAYERRYFFAVLIILSLSSFSHIWNSAGFPDIFYDEGIYMRRAMHVMEGLGVQERSFYDHPYFGQLFLAGLLSLVNYPQSLNPTTNANSIASLYAVPRILMGILAVFDTFLVYEIAKYRYNRRIAIVASLLFAVMPATWITRRILLDSILLPFLLSSVLLALYGRAVPSNSRKKKLVALASGVLLGVALFTKATSFLAVPLVGYLIYSGVPDKDKISTNIQRRRAAKTLGLWCVPVILIPLIWPVQAIAAGEFDRWVTDVFWQAGRTAGGIISLTGTFFIIDPGVLSLGIAGLVYSAIKKDYLILLWIIPYILFALSGKYVTVIHSIPILAPLFIAIAKLMDDRMAAVSNKFSAAKIQYALRTAIVLALPVFGIASTTLLITTDMTSAQFAAASYVLNNDLDEANTTIVSSPSYSWIFLYVFDKENVFWDYRDLLWSRIETSNVILISDPHFRANIGDGEQLQAIRDDTQAVKQFHGNAVKYDLTKYPYTNLFLNPEGNFIEIRIKNTTEFQ